MLQYFGLHCYQSAGEDPRRSNQPLFSSRLPHLHVFFIHPKATTSHKRALEVNLHFAEAYNGMDGKFCLEEKRAVEEKRSLRPCLSLLVFHPLKLPFFPPFIIRNDNKAFDDDTNRRKKRKVNIHLICNGNSYEGGKFHQVMATADDLPISP